MTGIAQVNDAIEVIEQVTYQHAEAIRQVEQVARELVAISMQLTGLTAPLMSSDPSDLSVTFTSPSERVEFNTEYRSQQIRTGIP